MPRDETETAYAKCRVARKRNSPFKHRSRKRGVVNRMDTLERKGSRHSIRREHHLEDGRAKEHEVDYNTKTNEEGKISSQNAHATRCSPTSGSSPSVPPLRALSFLDRFLVLWILLAMAIGILLGNLVPSTGPDLQKGRFVGVSIPIGKNYLLFKSHYILTLCVSHWSSCHDVPHLVQSPLRNPSSLLEDKISLGSDWFLVRFELDIRSSSHVWSCLGFPTGSSRST